MNPLSFETNETASLRYQLIDNGEPRDITGMTFMFAAKERNTDLAYRISPVSGSIDDAVNGKFSFEISMPSTQFAGVYSVVMTDAGGRRTVLTERGGTVIRVHESLVD